MQRLRCGLLADSASLSQVRHPLKQAERCRMAEQLRERASATRGRGVGAGPNDIRATHRCFGMTSVWPSMCPSVRPAFAKQHNVRRDYDRRGSTGASVNSLDWQSSRTSCSIQLGRSHRSHLFHKLPLQQVPGAPPTKTRNEPQPTEPTSRHTHACARTYPPGDSGLMSRKASTSSSSYTL
jgi:hypothetical protein